MSIKVEPSEIIRKIASDRKIKRMLSRGLSVRRAALAFVDEAGFVNRKDILDVALKVIKEYQKRVRGDQDAREKVAKDPKLLIHRVQNEVVFQMKESIKRKYAGQKYRWLPSDAETPDPEHQLKYGKIYRVGVGEMPGDRFGCRCGMEILVDEDKLDL